MTVTRFRSPEPGMEIGPAFWLKTPLPENKHLGHIRFQLRTSVHYAKFILSSAQLGANGGSIGLRVGSVAGVRQTLPSATHHWKQAAFKRCPSSPCSPPRFL